MRKCGLPPLAVLLWGSKSVKVKKSTVLVATSPENPLLMIEQLFGMFLITIAIAKLTTVFGHSEGTFLRRNLFVMFGVCSLGTAFIFNAHNAYLKTTYGADATPWIAVLAAEGLAYLIDALTRPRASKAKKP